MKTGKKIVLLIGILMLAFGLTALQIAHHRGVSLSASVYGNTVFTSSTNRNYDQKGYTVLKSGEKSFSAGDVKELDLDWISGSVSVERYDGKDVVVREEANCALKEDESMRWKLSNGELSILPCANIVRDLPNKELTVLVPKSLTLDGLQAGSASATVRVSGIETRGTLSLDAASGSLRVEDCLCGKLELDTASGSQTVLRTSVSGDVIADAASGSFTAEGLDCAKLDVETASGAVRAEKLFCDSVDIDTASGAVSLDFDTAPGKVEIDTISGAVTLAFPKGTGLVDIDTASGAVSLDFDTAPGKVEIDTISGAVTLAFPKGTGLVDIDTASGAVSLDFDTAPGKVEIDTISGAVTLAFPKGTGLDIDFDSVSGKLLGDITCGSLPVDVDTTSGSLTIEYK